MSNFRQQSQERNPVVPEQVASLMVLNLSEEEKREILLDVVSKGVKRFWEKVKEFYDHSFAPGVHLKPAKARRRFLELLAEGNQGDIEAAAVEFDYLMRLDYLDLIRAGQAPPPVSRPWAQLLAAPEIFRWAQQDFREIMRERLKVIDGRSTAVGTSA